MATDIVTRTGKGSALSAANYDQNVESFSGTVDQKTNDYTVLFTDQNKTIEFNKATAVTCNMSAIATIQSQIDTTSFRVRIKNIGAGTCTIDGSGAEAIDGSTTLALSQYDGATLQIDGAGSGWSVIERFISSAVPSSGTFTNGNLIKTNVSDQLEDAGIAAAAVTTNAGTSTLTNKTLTSPTLTTPTLNSPVLHTAVSGTAIDTSVTTSTTKIPHSNAVKTYADAVIPSGTLMLFQQTAAPTGWTKQTTHNNKALRVVSGTAGSGGSNAFTTALNTNVTTATEGAHTHGTGTLAVAGSTAFNGSLFGAQFNAANNGHTHTLSGSTGAGSAHSHTVNVDVQYVDLIIASKD